MLLRHQLVYDYELYQISILFPAFQYLASPLPILPYLSEKAQLQPDFFDTLSGCTPYGVHPLSLSRNPVCTQEQTGSRTYMSEKTAKRNEDNRFLHFHVANFFKFMAANLSFTQFVT